MARATSKIVRLELDKCDTMIPGWNVRENKVETYDDPALRANIATFGQLQLADAVEVNGRYRFIRGNRRDFNMQILRKEGATDPKTIKFDAEGKPIEGSGKVFEYIEARLWTGLTPGEISVMMIDQVDRRLNRVELFYAFERLAVDFTSQREIAITLFPILAQHYPPSRKIKPVEADRGQDLLNAYRGTIQAMMDAFELPVIARAAYIERLEQKHTWPTNKDVNTLLRAYKEDRKNDTTGKIDRENPGEKFNAEWQKLMDAVTLAANTGKAVKPISMLNRSQIEKAADGFQARGTRIAGGLFPLRNVTGATLAAFDTAMQKLERKVPDDMPDVDAGKLYRELLAAYHKCADECFASSTEATANAASDDEESKEAA